MSSAVAVPVCNERDRIIDCLKALCGQTEVVPGSTGILLFLNNCTDDTRERVDAFAPTSPCPIRVIERRSRSASAGWARREAMEAAAAWLEDARAADGILLTTDADSRVPENWVALNRAAVAAGADAVAGRTAFDPSDVARFPAPLRERQALELDYEARLAEIEARLAPRRGDPWPCHRTNSGASIAVRLDAYRQVGGIPPEDSGEDRAFIDLLRAHGLVVRHAPDIVVTTSGRLDGRARNGAADTLKRIGLDVDCPCDPTLEPLHLVVLRIAWRRLVRHGRMPSPGDRPRPGWPLRPSALPRQIRRADLLLRLIRWLEARRAYTRSSRRGLPGAPRKRLSTP